MIAFQSMLDDDLEQTEDVSYDVDMIDHDIALLS